VSYCGATATIGRLGFAFFASAGAPAARAVNDKSRMEANSLFMGNSSSEIGPRGVQ
jgi:hypothetical protein